MKFNPYDFPIPHACFPNCALNWQGELVFIRHVLPGEKLTIDYATLLPEGFDIECNCDYTGCRKRIRGFRYLPVCFQDFYLENDAVYSQVAIASGFSKGSSRCEKLVLFPRRR